MKNETKYSDEEINEIIEADSSLSEEQVLHIAAIVDNYRYSSNEERLVALEYVSIIISQMQLYNIKESDASIDYAAKRVIMTMYPDRKYSIQNINNKLINNDINMILVDLQVELHERKMSKIKTLKY